MMADQFHENHLGIFVFDCCCLYCGYYVINTFKESTNVHSAVAVCRKCAMQVACIKVGYNSFNVLPAKDLYRAASVKSNAKFSRLIPSRCNRSSTVYRIILLLTLLLLSSERHSIRDVSFGVSTLPTYALMYFCLSTSALCTTKNTFLSGSSSRIFSFGDAN